MRHLPGRLEGNPYSRMRERSVVSVRSAANASAVAPGSGTKVRSWIAKNVIRLAGPLQHCTPNEFAVRGDKANKGELFVRGT